MKALIVTASIVLAALVLGVAALAIFPDPNAGDPSVIVPITLPEGGIGKAANAPAAAPEPAPSPPSPSEQAPAPIPEPGGEAGTSEIPPGFAVVVPDGSGTPPPRPGGPPAAPVQAPANSGVSIDAPQGDSVREPPPAPETEPRAEADPGPGPLPVVPVADLVENSEYGPLPKIAADGRKPLEVYARPSAYAAKAAAGAPARVALLIDGLGTDAAAGEAIKTLPSTVSVAYGAYGHDTQDWVTKARASGHEVLLQVPLEPVDYPKNDPGPHTLLTTLPPAENMKRLEWLMSRFTGYVGVTNLMGAKFETSQEQLLPVLEEIKSRGLIYVDDGNVQASSGGQIAGTIGLDYAVANVQIDASPSPAEIAKSLAKLEGLAKERGMAIGVASAKPATLKQLADWAGKLEGKGIVLVPVSAAVRSLRQS